MDPHHFGKPAADPHESEKPDPDQAPHQSQKMHPDPNLPRSGKPGAVEGLNEAMDIKRYLPYFGNCKHYNHTVPVFD
jgi:hypothetical protein